MRERERIRGSRSRRGKKRDIERGQRGKEAIERRETIKCDLCLRIHETLSIDCRRRRPRQGWVWEVQRMRIVYISPAQIGCAAWWYVRNTQKQIIAQRVRKVDPKKSNTGPELCELISHICGLHDAHGTCICIYILNVLKPALVIS